MAVEKDSKMYLTISLKKGLYQYKEGYTVFGIASVPAIWQQAVDQVLQGIPRIQCYLDGIIVFHENEEDMKTLKRALECLVEYGM